jgi:hypothetical protein
MAGESAKPAKPPERAGQSAVEIVRQIDDVRDMLTMGRQRHQICQAMATRYGLPTRTIDRRISQARQQMVQELERTDRKELAATLINAAYEILAEARESKQLSNGLGALGFIARVTQISD